MHRTLPKKILQSSFQHQFRGSRKKINHASDANEYEADGEQPALRAQRFDLAEADRGDGDDRHIQSVNERHVFDRYVAAGAKEDDEQDPGQRKTKAAPGASLS